MSEFQFLHSASDKMKDDASGAEKEAEAKYAPTPGSQTRSRHM